MRIRCYLIGVLLVLLVPAAPALAANQTVVAQSLPFDRFNPAHVGVNVGEMVTWNNSSGTHNVHFDDGSFDMPPTPQSGAWTAQRTFNTPGLYRYYCELHGGPNGVGMSGTVAVNTGYVRPQSASPLRASLVVAYKPCTAPNRQHGPPLAFGSCNPPAQESDWVTSGTPDANGAGANFAGSVKLVTQVGNPATMADEANVQIVTSLSDVRNKAGLADYTGQLETRLALRVTDRHNGLSRTEPGTGDATINVTVPCATTSDPNTGSTCTATTTADAIAPGTVLEGRRSIWDLGKVQVFDGGSDGQVSTTPNTLFAAQGLFVP